MGIGANDQLSRQRVTFQNYRVTDPFRPFTVFQLSVQADAPLPCKILLLQLELRGKIEQSHLPLLL